MEKQLPAIQETQVWSLGWEDPLEKGMDAYSKILAWRIPWTEKPGGRGPQGHKESDKTEGLTCRYDQYIKGSKGKSRNR